MNTLAFSPSACVFALEVKQAPAPQVLAASVVDIEGYITKDRNEASAGSNPIQICVGGQQHRQREQHGD